MLKTIGKLFKYGFILGGAIFCFAFIVMLFSGDEPNKQASSPPQHTQSEQASRTSSTDQKPVRPLSELRSIEKRMIAAQDKLWRDFEAETDSTKREEIYKNIKEAMRLQSDLSKDIVKAKNQQSTVTKAQIERQFSKWDGSHRLLVKMVKKAMNDPDSFDHDTTKYRGLPNDAGIQVSMIYRGKNAFGAVVRESIQHNSI